MPTAVSKNQRVGAISAPARSAEFISVLCGVCGTRLRAKFRPGRGNKARIQHGRWFVCENGHLTCRKRN